MQLDTQIRKNQVDRPSPDSAIALAQQGRNDAAEKTFQQELRLLPNDPVSHHNYAVFLSSRQRDDEATRHYREALRLRPDYFEAIRNFAILLTNQRKFEEAVRHLWTVFRMRPDDIQTMLTLGNGLLAARRTSEAIPVLRQAARLAASDATIHNQLGLTLFDSGRFVEAESTFLEALRIDPHFVSAHNNLGSLYKAMGRTSEAFACFEIALALDPNSVLTKWNRALTYLSVGDFEQGWNEYEWRWHRPETPPRTLPKPLWNGEPIQGKRILLYTEQGLGDTIQFIRYASLLKEQGAFVIFECSSPLAGVLHNVMGVDQFIIEGQPIPPFDFHAPLMGLPRLFKTTLANMPAWTSYVVPEPDRVANWRQRLKGLAKPDEFLVGISWQGNPHHQWDHFRSLRLMQLEPLASVPGVRLVSLQRGPGIQQIADFQRRTDNALLVPTDGQQTTPEHLADAAALMANLDLIISVDSAPAHLAAALGRRTWTLLSYVADWRWMIDRLDSPWYPTMRLFRQKIFGDWDEVLTRVAAQLTSTVRRQSLTNPS